VKPECLVIIDTSAGLLCGTEKQISGMQAGYPAGRMDHLAIIPVEGVLMRVMDDLQNHESCKTKHDQNHRMTHVFSPSAGLTFYTKSIAENMKCKLSEPYILT
jgi:hypothetical protein